MIRQPCRRRCYTHSSDTTHSKVSRSTMRSSPQLHPGMRSAQTGICPQTQLPQVETILMYPPRRWFECTSFRGLFPYPRLRRRCCQSPYLYLRLHRHPSPCHKTEVSPFFSICIMMRRFEKFFRHEMFLGNIPMWERRERFLWIHQY